MSMIVVRANSSEKITHSFDSSLIIELILLMVHVIFFFWKWLQQLGDLCITLIILN